MACCGALAACSIASNMASCVTSTSKETKPSTSKFIFTTILTCGFIIAFFFTGGVNLDSAHFLQSACNYSRFVDLCNGDTMIYRVSFSLFVFYGIHAIVAIITDNWGTPEASDQFQTSFWGVKILVLVGLFFAFTQIPNNFYTWYSTGSFLGAALFILVQILILIDFAYSWNETWVEAGKTSGLLVSTLIFYSSAIVGCVLMYIWFGGSGCDKNSIFITITILLGVVFTLLTFKIETCSILVSSIVFGYIVFITFGAMRSGNAGSECNFFYDPQPRKFSFHVLFSALTAIFSVFYSCWSAASSRGAFSISSDTEEEQHEKGWAFFHFMLMLGSCYMCMLLTSWSLNDVQSAKVDTSTISMWVKLASAWLTGAVYIWTQVAPILFPDRFGEDSMY